MRVSSVANDSSTLLFSAAKMLKRIASYARSSAELLSKLILHGADGSYTWEVSIVNVQLLFPNVSFDLNNGLCSPVAMGCSVSSELL